MKIKLFDNVTVLAEPAEVYMLLLIHSKLTALRKAGWSLAKIADELSVSVPTVSQHLKGAEK